MKYFAVLTALLVLTMGCGQGDDVDPNPGQGDDVPGDVPEGDEDEPEGDGY